MKASELDKRFDEGAQDVIDEFDLSSATRPNREQKRVNVDFPVWMVESLDREADPARRHASVDHQGMDRRAPRAGRLTFNKRIS